MFRNMNINFNTQNMQDFMQITQVCTQHRECKDCPVYSNNGLHVNQSVIICHKVEEKLMKEQMNNAKHPS